MTGISRFACHISRSIAVVAALALALTVSPTGAHAQNPSRYEELARDILRELIEINTTHSIGSTTDAAEAMAARLRMAGFPDSDVQVLGAIPRKGNLVARWRGNGSTRQPLLLLAHLDVVEADPADWTVDPFTFLERDGYFYGRGTTDDKAQAAIWIALMIRLREEGFRPERDIIVALTADEEGGTANGVIWLLENHPELIDAAFALNEGAGGALKNGERLSNNVQASEKVYLSFQLEVTNPGGHSSLPVKDNAIYHLAAALTQIGEHDFPVELNEITRTYFERTAEIEGGEVGEAMRSILLEPPDPAGVALLATNPAYNSRMRTTCVATMVNAGHAENALPQRAQAIVNCRMLPGTSPEEVQGALARLVANEKVMITPTGTPIQSPPSPLTPELLDVIERITDEMWPGVPVVPTMLTGATDGLFLRNKGIPVYGISGIFGEIDDVRAHGRDERVSVKAFYEGFEFLYRLVRELSR